MVCLLFMLLAFVTATKASPIQSTFTTTCTFPNITTHFVSSPDTRGTLDILWSCLFTIIACTLTIQHLNVPEQREGRDPGWRGDLKWTLKDTWRSLKWMLITVLAPEVLLARAAGDLQFARLNQVELKRFAQEDGVPWSLTHTFFANMGGFAIKRAEESNTLLNPKSGRTSASTGQDPIPNPYHVMADDIISLRKSGRLSKLPCITTEEIKDKSKANLFIKAIAITQICWIVVQILLRTARKLAVSQLELAVLAFSVCAIIIYVLYWQKPKDVKTSLTLMLLPTEAFESNVHYLQENHSEEGNSGLPYEFYHTLAQEFKLSTKQIRLGHAIPNDCGAGDNVTGRYSPAILTGLGLFFGCFVFGGIHVAAWGFHFPTMVDTILWRVASILCSAFPFLYILVFVLIRFFGYFDTMIETEKLERSLWQAAVLVYILGRLILLVEIFRTLLFLPPDAFVTTSASNIPHVS